VMALKQLITKGISREAIDLVIIWRNYLVVVCCIGDW
jgi:hypothetical protein